MYWAPGKEESGEVRGIAVNHLQLTATQNIEDFKLLQQTRYLQANYIIAVRKPKLLQSTRIGYKTVKFLPSNVY